LNSRHESHLFGLVTAVVCVSSLYFGRVVFVPFALSLLFSLLLSPVVTFLERIRVPRMAAVLLVVMSLFGATGALGWLTSEQLGDLTKQLPIYKQTLETKIRTLQGMQCGPFCQRAFENV
jgi:predicted PurR-regulated permease PerM